MPSDATPRALSPAFFRRYWAVVLLPTVVATAVTGALALRGERLYEADARIFISRYTVNVSLSGGQTATIDPIAVARAQVDVAQSLPVLRAALESVGRSSTESVRRRFLERSHAAAGDGVVTLTVSDPDSNTAQRLATAWAHEAVAFRRALDAQPLRNARARLRERAEEVRAAGGRNSELLRSLIDKQAQLEAAEAIQLANGIVFRPAGVVRRVGAGPAKQLAFAALAGLALGMALALLLDSRSRPPRTRERLPHAPEDELSLYTPQPHEQERVRT